MLARIISQRDYTQLGGVSLLSRLSLFSSSSETSKVGEAPEISCSSGKDDCASCVWETPHEWPSWGKA